MSMPLEQQQPPPIALSAQQAHRSHSGSGSIGAVIGVLAVIAILGVIAGMIGRLCSGRRIMGHGEFDLDGWIERKCSSCIDGRIENPTTMNTGNSVTADDDVPVAIPIQTPSEMKKTEEAHQNPSENLGS